MKQKNNILSQRKLRKRIQDRIMIQEKIDRINELARKSRTPEGLTEEEKAEQKILREYRVECP